MNSIYYSEINQIIYNLGHREDFLHTTTEAVDTLFLNYLQGRANNVTIKQFAAIQIQDFYNNYVMENLKSGLSETWGKNVIAATYMCLYKISEKDEYIKILFNTFKTLVLNE